MKILVVSKSFTKGGSASGARNLVNSLEVAGAEVIKVDARGASSNTLFRTIERVYERLVHDAETHCLRVGPPSLNLLDLYDIHKPDIVQLCDVSANTIAFSQMIDIPCPIVHRLSDFWPYHGASHYAASPPYRDQLADWLLHRLIYTGKSMPDILVSPSHWLADRLIAGGIEKDRISVIRNAVSTSDERKPKKRDGSPLRLGFIAGSIIDPRKGLANLFPFLTNLYVNPDVDISSDFYLFGGLRGGKLPLIPNIEWIPMGKFARHQLDDVYSSFDVLLCPSILDNSPNVVTEALSYGIPVIAQSGTGMDSYVTPEVGGTLDFTNPNQKNFQKFTQYVSAIDENYSSYSMSALNFAKEDLSPRVIGLAYLNLYNSLIGRLS